MYETVCPDVSELSDYSPFLLYVPDHVLHVDLIRHKVDTPVTRQTT